MGSGMIAALRSCKLNVMFVLLCMLYFLPCLCFKSNLNIQQQSWRVTGSSKQSKQSLSTPLQLQYRPVHLLYTDACMREGGGYFLNGQSYSQFRWTQKERYKYGAARLTPLEKTDIRILEFVAAVTAIYTERERLKGSCVELRIDNPGSCKWLITREINHLWGQGWMRLLDRVCKDYNIVINPVAITGAENPVADALSRFNAKKLRRMRSSVLRGAECMTSRGPTPAWRDQVWNERDSYWQQTNNNDNKRSSYNSDDNSSGSICKQCC